jgi:hypothetical protein
MARKDGAKEARKGKGHIDWRCERPKTGLSGVPGNPVAELQKKSGLNMVHFALAAGMSYPTLVSLIRGMVAKITPKALAALKTVGASDDLPEEYATWRREAMAALQAKLVEAQATDGIEDIRE